jgi:hypothetical protein
MHCTQWRQQHAAARPARFMADAAEAGLETAFRRFLQS